MKLQLWTTANLGLIDFPTMKCVEQQLSALNAKRAAMVFSVEEYAEYWKDG